MEKTRLLDYDALPTQCHYAFMMASERSSDDSRIESACVIRSVIVLHFVSSKLNNSSVFSKHSF